MQRLERPGRLQFWVIRLVWGLISRAKDLVSYLRYHRIYPQFEHVGQDVVFDRDIYFNEIQNISIGEGSFIGKSCYLNAVDDLEIGEQCMIAAECHLMTWNHRIDSRRIALREEGRTSAPVTLGDGVWMGYNAIVLPGVTIGDGAVVGAGSVVTDDVDAFDIVAGVPARPIGRRTDEGIEYYDERDKVD